MRFVQVWLENYRVDVILALYERRGARAVLDQSLVWSSVDKEPKLPLQSMLFQVYKMRSLLDLRLFSEAEEIARWAIADGLPNVRSQHDREFLHLLFELHFCDACEEPKWMTDQARARTWDDRKLSGFLGKRVAVTVQKLDSGL